MSAGANAQLRKTILPFASFTWSMLMTVPAAAQDYDLSTIQFPPWLEVERTDPSAGQVSSVVSGASLTSENSLEVVLRYRTHRPVFVSVELVARKWGGYGPRIRGVTSVASGPARTSSDRGRVTTRVGLRCSPDAPDLVSGLRLRYSMYTPEGSRLYFNESPLYYHRILCLGTATRATRGSAATPADPPPALKGVPPPGPRPVSSPIDRRVHVDPPPKSAIDREVRERPPNLSSVIFDRSRNGCLESVEILSNTQSQFGSDVRIGVGNIWAGPYEDERGATRHGLSVGLSVFVRGRPAENLRVRVGPASRFRAGGEEFRVLEVRPGGVKLCRLDLSTGR